MKLQILRAWCGLFLGALAALASGTVALAGVQGEAGHYRIEITTEPAVIPVGKAKVILQITDAAGRPVEGAEVRALVKMPSMSMGEREEIARPKPGEPGVYESPAVFAMAGKYSATVKITGAHGAATTGIPLATGQNTGASAGAGLSTRTVLTWLVGLLALAFVLYRVRRTGQRPNWRVVFNRSVLAGLLLLAVMLGASNYAIRNFRRQGAMTPIEAQAMEMSTPAPPGTAPVELATVERGTVESTVRYTGSAVGYVEQDVYPRVTGWITWMPFYAGDRVRRGQLLVRLDTSQVDPPVAERQAALAMAGQSANVARTEYEQALAGVHEAHAEVGMVQSRVDEARANLTAAREERAGAEADLAAAESQVTDASEQLVAAQADQEYWSAELRRMGTLLTAGAVSGEEYQREKAQAENAEAKVHQAQARIQQVQAQVRAAQSRLRKADAVVAAASSKIQQATSELDSHYAHVSTAEAGVKTVRRRIDQAEAGVRQARASLDGAATTRGYTEIRSEVDGVVTQRVISPGVLVNPGQAILKVAQIRPIRLQANVAETDLSRMRVGAPVTVFGKAEGGGKPVSARVTSIAPAVDPVARTAVVEAVLPNPDGRFLPGQYVTMSISTGRSDRTLRVPSTAVRWHTRASGAVLSTQATPYVWVAEPAEGDEYTVRPADIRVGRDDGTTTEVLSGLKEGEQVVSAGHQDLKIGDTVMDVSARVTTDHRPPTTDPTPRPKAEGPIPNAQHPTINDHRPTRYTCPMHPEVVQDRPGKCPKCGMELVPREGGAR
jgi:RND family efflux transporter MFP subunit